MILSNVYPHLRLWNNMYTLYVYISPSNWYSQNWTSILVCCSGLHHCSGARQGRRLPDRLRSGQLGKHVRQTQWRYKWRQLFRPRYDRFEVGVPYDSATFSHMILKTELHWLDSLISGSTQWIILSANRSLNSKISPQDIFKEFIGK